MLVSLLTREHGRTKGMYSRSKNRLDTELGTFVEVHWQARLQEHLGRFQLETRFSPFSHIVGLREALLCLSAACAWIELLLPENESHPELFDAMHLLIHHLGHPHFLLYYLKFEQTLLKATGMDLSLTHCAATGQSHDLIYISPKTGRAVSAEAGAPYHHKLLLLPPCLQKDITDSSAVNPVEILQAFDVVEYFLEHFVLHVHNLEIPNVRQRLRASIAQSLNHYAS